MFNKTRHHQDIACTVHLLQLPRERSPLGAAPPRVFVPSFTDCFREHGERAGAAVVGELCVQIIHHLFSVDNTQETDHTCINAASAALMVSDIPWHGPVGAVRVAVIGGQMVLFPTNDQVRHVRSPLSEKDSRETSQHA